MAWCRPCDRPLSESMVFSLPTHLCVTRHQWVILDSSNKWPSAEHVFYTLKMLIGCMWVNKMYFYKNIYHISFNHDSALNLVSFIIQAKTNISLIASIHNEFRPRAQIPIITIDCCIWSWLIDWAFISNRQRNSFSSKQEQRYFILGASFANIVEMRLICNFTIHCRWI